MHLCQHPEGQAAPADKEGSEAASILGLAPHQIRYSFPYLLLRTSSNHQPGPFPLTVHLQLRHMAACHSTGFDTNQDPPRTPGPWNLVWSDSGALTAGSVRAWALLGLIESLQC